VRRQRRLALGVLVGAAVLAAFAVPFRATWWGGWVLAIAEAGIVGGLADWFAVTAIFRHPLGLPIPHTALIPANWEGMAERVGVMVGGRVLTKEYVLDEIGRVDLADLIARGAERISADDLDAATRAVADWAVEQMTPTAASELMARLRTMLAEQPAAPTLAAALRIARQNGWDRRVVQGLVNVLADAMERPEFRTTIGEVIEDLMLRYRARLGVYPRLFIGFAELIGVLDRDRLVEALHSGLRQVAKDADHPLRTRASEVVAELEQRLIQDTAWSRCSTISPPRCGGRCSPISRPSGPRRSRGSPRGSSVPGRPSSATPCCGWRSPDGPARGWPSWSSDITGRSRSSSRTAFARWVPKARSA
jgi:uncharacterized membrane-anchored protein YjiN (DUF445 family)